MNGMSVVTVAFRLQLKYKKRDASLVGQTCDCKEGGGERTASGGLKTTQHVWTEDRYIKIITFNTESSYVF